MKLMSKGALALFVTLSLLGNASLSLAEESSQAPSPAVAAQMKMSLLMVSLRWQAVHFARFQRELIKNYGDKYTLSEVKSYSTTLSAQDQKRFAHLSPKASQLSSELTINELSEVSISNTHCVVITPASEETSFQSESLCQTILSDGKILNIHFYPSQELSLANYDQLTEFQKITWLYEGVIEKPIEVKTTITAQ